MMEYALNVNLVTAYCLMGLASISVSMEKILTLMEIVSLAQLVVRTVMTQKHVINACGDFT